MMRIAYLGPEGTVSHEATECFFAGQSTSFIPYPSIADVFHATVQGDTDLSVIPIENTIDGSVNPHLDFLVHENDLPIQAEWVYPSVQHLIGHPNPDGDGIEHVRRIVSIPVAIAQCRDFLKRELPHAQYEHVASTAEGVRTVQRMQTADLAAIGTQLAADRYGLHVLAHNITDHHNNFTRFILVGGQAFSHPSAGQAKSTILVTLPEDYPGALHQVLSAFAWRRINLSKIESRPTKKKLGSYYFYIDIEESMDSVLLPAALQEVEAIGCQVRILGSYQSYSYESVNSEV